MAMLAEPRRRQRIGPNPRGKFFMEDEDNKGRTLLHKLGWEAGKGLGRDNQGMSAPLQPKIQMDSKGLGFDVKSNPWVAHTEEFSQVLENLKPIMPGNNKDTPVSSDDDDDNDDKGEEEESTPRKLEKMSKSSRSRIHYHKFVKSKDVSNFSNTDLKCIFGKPAESLVSSKNKKKKKSKSETPTLLSLLDIKSEEGTAQVKTEAPDLQQQQNGNAYEEDGVKVINRGSMSDYFKAKMEQKRLNALNGSTTTEVKIKVERNDDESEVKSEVNIISSLGSDENSLIVNEIKNENQQDVGEEAVGEETKRIKKSKKNKRKRKAEVLEEEEQQQEEAEVLVNEIQKNDNEDNDSLEKLIEASKAYNYSKKEKRKKAKKAKLEQAALEHEGEEEQNETLMEIQVEETKKDKKKRKKNKKSGQEPIIEESIVLQEEEEEQVMPEEIKEKKKKKKKSKQNNIPASEIVEDIVDQDESTNNYNDESSAADDSITTSKKFKKFDKRNLTRDELREISALSFPGSNLDQIPGYLPY